MARTSSISRRTRVNWLIDAAVFVGGVIAALSGIYFLFMPSGRAQDAHNLLPEALTVFERAIWSDLHTWGGVFMIIAVLVHFVFHWSWITMMSKRLWNRARGSTVRMSRGAVVNLVVDAAIAICFLLTALSGLYFLFGPSGGYQGERNPSWDPGFLWSRTTWDLIHTWAGVILIVAAVIHFVIHWRWVKNVTRRFFGSLWRPVTASGLGTAHQ